jgi:hypothetical protein
MFVGDGLGKVRVEAIREVKVLGTTPKSAVPSMD